MGAEVTFENDNDNDKENEKQENSKKGGHGGTGSIKI